MSKDEISDEELIRKIQRLRDLRWLSSWHRARLAEAEFEAASRGLKV